MLAALRTVTWSPPPSCVMRTTTVVDGTRPASQDRLRIDLLREGQRHRVAQTRLAGNARVRGLDVRTGRPGVVDGHAEAALGHRIGGHVGGGDGVRLCALGQDRIGGHRGAAVVVADAADRVRTRNERQGRLAGCHRAHVCPDGRHAASGIGHVGVHEVGAALADESGQVQGRLRDDAAGDRGCGRVGERRRRGERGRVVLAVGQQGQRQLCAAADQIAQQHDRDGQRCRAMPGSHVSPSWWPPGSPRCETPPPRLLEQPDADEQRAQARRG